MNKFELQSNTLKTNTAYLLWFFFGASYAYQGKWFKQILYWFTAGGLGVWMVIEGIRLGGKIDSHNARIYAQIDDIEKKEKREHLENLKAMNNN